MKTFSGPLTSLLATRDFEMCDMYEFTLVNGTALRYCTSDFPDVLWAGHTFLSSRNGPAMEREGEHSKCSWKTGVEVSTLDFMVVPRDEDLVGGLSFMNAVDAGAFDGALLTLMRAYFPSWPQPPALTLVPTGVVTLFPTGKVVEANGGIDGVNFSVNSNLQCLDTQLPRHMHQSGCKNTLYDGGCTLVKATFTTSGTVVSTVDGGNFNTNVTGQNDSYYDLGVIKFTSGLNAGFSRTIKRYTKANGTLELLSPFYSVPTVGDAFSIYPGCAKSLTVCTTKFANQANFGGTPYVPAAETAI